MCSQPSAVQRCQHSVSYTKPRRSLKIIAFFLVFRNLLHFRAFCWCCFSVCVCLCLLYRFDTLWLDCISIYASFFPVFSFIAGGSLSQLICYCRWPMPMSASASSADRCKFCDKQSIFIFVSAACNCKLTPSCWHPNPSNVVIIIGRYVYAAAMFDVIYAYTAANCSLQNYCVRQSLLTNFIGYIDWMARALLHTKAPWCFHYAVAF